jgi:hypothetical protein
MAGKQAKILTTDALHSLLAYAASTRHPVRNTVIVLLSVKAGLRAGEIANLTWPMVLDAKGDIGLASPGLSILSKMWLATQAQASRAVRSGEPSYES